MAGPNFVLDKGFLLEGTVGIKEGVCLELGTGRQTVKPMSGAGKFAIGVVQETVTNALLAKAAGKVVVNVRMMGISDALTKSTVAAGDQVAAAADGTVAKATAGQSVVGVALAAAGANEMVEVLLTPGIKGA